MEERLNITEGTESWSRGTSFQLSFGFRLRVVSLWPIFFRRLSETMSKTSVPAENSLMCIFTAEKLSQQTPVSISMSVGMRQAMIIKLRL